MLIMGLLLVTSVKFFTLQTAEQTGFHKQAEQQNICLVFPLPMQIHGTLLAIPGQSLELQTAEQTGLHKQAEQLNNLFGVFFTDANNGTVVGDDGTILRTTNGGTNWTSQTSGTTENLIWCFLY